MSPFAALFLAAAAASAPAPKPAVERAGVQVVSVQARAAIVEAAVVRQASGAVVGRDRMAPRITRRGTRVEVEFQ